MATVEHRRLTDPEWGLWGPYLSDRSWGTVREDYSDDGDVWNYFPHEHARSRTYRWTEDGLAGISDRSQYLCMALSLWNGEDHILKERLFGLTNPQGNHGEDVKEEYWHLDAVPSHAYLSMRYRYPMAAYPYDELVAENALRTRAEPEYELEDTGVLLGESYWDVDVEYVKDGPTGVVMLTTVHNRSVEDATIHVIPTLWFRNTWSWGYPNGPMQGVDERPEMKFVQLNRAGWVEATADHERLGRHHWYAEGPQDLWFTENETNPSIFGLSEPGYYKDAFHRRLIDRDAKAVNADRVGTKAAAWWRLDVPAGGSKTVRVRLSAEPLDQPFADVDALVTKRKREADEFYSVVQRSVADEHERLVQRRAFAGLIWTKQLYYFDVSQWLAGDPAYPPPERFFNRNADWQHLNNFDVLSMPDGWEYPWYAAWDLAFHALPLAMIDPEFAKHTLILMGREWYQHPNGQIPAYEWGFGNVNPPVFAWATRRVYELDHLVSGHGDKDFMEAMFHKLMLNFTWWVNRLDPDENNVFQGGFLGLDNVSVFDRSMELPGGGHVDQSDGTAWMAFYTLGMLKIAFELAKDRPVYEAVATKFFEHFLAIAKAINGPETGVWDPIDEFYYDVVRLPDGRKAPLRVRSMVGLLPLLAVELVRQETLNVIPDFERRMKWVLKHRPELAACMAPALEEGRSHNHLLSVVDESRLRAILKRTFDPDEFLSPFGIRSLSKAHEEEPFDIELGGRLFEIGYEPGESQSGLFGGNSNWRGPIWFPINYLLIEALREYHAYYGGRFTIECPTGSGVEMTLGEAAQELAKRLVSLFDQNEAGDWTYGARGENPLFFEYFDGDTGRGLGASHQTGWTALVAKLIAELA
ncbi:MAG: glucosidase [Acidimicrobiia bacterium]|nr:glucosidase [Acidimicrobiia bacterium]